MDKNKTSLHAKHEIEICEEPVFIIGSPRSGTSVLAWSLVHHGDFWTSPETDFLYWLYGRGQLRKAVREVADRTDRSWLNVLHLDEKDLMAALGLGVNALISSKSKGRRWVDQSPTYTLVASELSDLFPGARFLHIVRDGRSVVHSMINSGFAARWASDFTLACRTWADFVRAGTRFEATCLERCLRVSYADLVADPAAGFEEIHDFLNAPRRPGSAEFFSTQRINSSFQSAEPGSYVAPPEPWSVWTKAQRETFRREAGAAMEAVGFGAELHAGV